MKQIKAAFTIPEMLVAVAILAVVVAMAGQSMFDGNRFMNSNANQISMQAAARNVVDILGRDIRESGSAPSNATLSANNNTVTVNGLTYRYTSPSKLLRNGTVIASGVERVSIAASGRLYTISVTTNTSDVLALQRNFTLDAKVRRRN
jgi:prepilin-type N-terminal cleavage/methylation domain-containing protein